MSIIPMIRRLYTVLITHSKDQYFKMTGSVRLKGHLQYAMIYLDRVKRLVWSDVSCFLIEAYFLKKLKCTSLNFYAGI